MLVIITLQYHCSYKRNAQALCTLFHIKGATFFKKGQLQGGLKQVNLEQNPV